jgi:two-component system sensor histidine kinase UhpB
LINKIKILHLEDLRSDAELVERELKKGNIQYEKIVVDNKTDYINALKKFSPDIIISDHSLPSFNSVEALKIVKEAGLNIPFILVTATMSEEYVVDMMKQGISDYVLKDRLKRLPTAVNNALEKNLAERERQKFLEQVIASEAFMKEAQRLANLGSFEADFKNNIVKWSDELYKILGYEVGEVEASFDNLLKRVHPEDVPLLKESTEHTIKNLDFIHRQYRLKMKDNSIRYIDSELFVERDKAKNAIGVKGFNQDITVRILLEKKLTEEKIKSQQEITDAVITAQEKERAFLGEELHDNINQILATSKLYMEVALADNSLRKDLMTDSRIFLMNAMEEIRKLSKSLLPPSLGGTTLSEALNELIENIRQLNKIQFIKEWEIIDESLVDEKLSLAIFRIVQEQLNNIFKHAKAKTVTICLKQSFENLQLKIKDDGIGFDIAEKRNGIGLKNIVSRTDLFNGKMSIDSQPGKGCLLEVNFKIEPQKK